MVRDGSRGWRGHTPKASPRSLGFSWGNGEPGKGSGPGSAGRGKDLPGAPWTLAGGRGQGSQGCIRVSRCVEQGQGQGNLDPGSARIPASDAQCQEQGLIAALFVTSHVSQDPWPLCAPPPCAQKQGPSSFRTILSTCFPPHPHQLHLSRATCCLSLFFNLILFF